MKRLRKLHRFASTFAFAALTASAFLSVTEVHAQSSETQDKIRLMATALRARESGDLLAAKANLEDLLRINPDDQNVQRLLDSVNKDIERSGTGQPTIYGQAASVTTFEPANVTVTDSTTVVPVTNGDGTETTTQVILTGGGDVDYLMSAASSEQQQAIARGEQAMADAKVLIKNDRSDEADAILEAAQNSIPESKATVFVLDDIRNMRGDIILDAGQEALSENNTTAALAAVQAYRDTLGDDDRLANFEKQVKQLEMNPWRQDPNILSPEYVTKVDTVDDILVTARAMMLYGDYAGARAKLGEVEARDSNNPAAKALQMEIMQQLNKTAWLDHSKTRDQMLEDVARSWQRPQVYELETTQAVVEGPGPILTRLKSIYIPRVSFSGVPLSRVVETLSELSVEYDPNLNAEERNRGVNIVLLNTGGADPLVNITLRSLSLDRILDFATESVGYTWDISDETVIVSKGDTAGNVRLETEFFPIARSVIIRLTGGGNGGGGGGGAPADPFSTAPAAATGPSGGDEEESLRNFFTRAGIDFAEPGSSLAFDGTQLIVTQTPKNLEKMRVILRRYDQTKQVEIEAKFLDVIQGNLDELGFNWSVSSASGKNSISTANQTLNDIFSINTQNSNITIDNTTTNFNTGVQTTTTNTVPAGAPDIPNAIDLGALGGIVGSFMGVIQGVDVNLTVNALSRQEGSDLLSAPKLTVLSGRTAQIVVAQELRYPENYGDIEAEVSQSGTSLNGVSGGSSVAITAGTPQDFTVRNVGVEMEVTPTVEENDNISLKLEPRVTEFEGFVEYGGPSIAISGGTTVTVPSGFYQPIFSTREVRTEVTIFDGATVVIGGLTREEIKTIEDKVPVLGDIPFLGRLFQSKGETAQKRNLLIFVTANLISPGGSPARQTIGTVEANSLFQSPVVVTPGGSVSREINE